MQNVQKFFLIPMTGFLISIISVVISVLAGIGTRFNWWYFRVGLTLIQVSAIAGLIAVTFSIIGMIILLFLKNKKGLILGIMGLILGLIVFAVPFMGFKDDIVIHIAKNNTGSRVDIRSVSRVGRGDFGKNAARVRKFLSQMKK